MIHEAAHTLESRNFSIALPINDQDGTIGYGLHRDRDKYILVAKEYAYKGLASVMERLVKQASGEGMNLIFYEDSDETFTVFDAAYYSKHGAVSTGMSKTRDTRWLELPLDDGAPLDQYLNGATSPTTLAGENETLGGFA